MASNGEKSNTKMLSLSNPSRANICKKDGGGGPKFVYLEIALLATLGLNWINEEADNILQTKIEQNDARVINNYH